MRNSPIDARAAPLIRFARDAVRAVLVVATASVALGGVAFAATTLRADYGAPHIQVAVAEWALRSPTYSRASCVQCHGDASAAIDSGSHGSLTCEVCHTPTVSHPGSTSGVVVYLPALTATICARCHVAAPGQGTSFPQIALAEHYPGADCLQCHNPHTAKAPQPPDVAHPLAHLPACIACHNPDGMAPFPAGHRLEADAACFTCHTAEASLR